MPPKHHHHDHDHHHHDKHHESPSKYDDYDWKDLPPHLKEAAGTLNWDQKLWDDDGKANTEDLDWDELSHEQRKAAEQFGYHPKLWDKGHGKKKKHHPPHHHDHHHRRGSSSSSSSGSSSSSSSNDHKADANVAPKKEEEGAKDEDVTADVDADISKLDVNTNNNVDDTAAPTKKKKKKKPFQISKFYGGDGGAKFDHNNHPHITKIVLYTDGHVVRGVEMSYTNTVTTTTQKAGECGGTATTFELEKGEFITSATVRSNKYVQSLGFKTNKGKVLGPVGGKGWAKIDLRGNDSEGEEVTVEAPYKYQLSGLTGGAGKWIDQVAFRWGPVQQGKGN